MTDADANLALIAQATASESFEDFKPEKASDGDPNTRWSCVPGHNEDVWYQLAWEEPVTIRQIAVRQFDSYVTQLDIQAYSETAKKWKTVQHLGGPNTKLPLIVSASFEPFKARKIRFANICGGPSFTEVEVYSEERPNKTVLASDANGHIIGIVCDHWGGTPVDKARVTLTGRAITGEWIAHAESDEHGLFFVPMPVGLSGEIGVKTETHGSPVLSTWKSEDLQYGLTPQSFGASAKNLNGSWKFCLDPPEDFFKEGFDDSKWVSIKVPAHWSMEGHRSLSGIAAYRKTFSLPPGKGRLKIRFDGVYSGAEVWFNGVRVAYHEGGALPFEFDATDFARSGKNTLALRVSEHTRTSDELDKMSIYADFPLGGIFRKVWLFWVPEAHIGALSLSTKWDGIYKHATIEGVASIINESDVEFKRTVIQAKLIDRKGRETRFEPFAKVGALKPWSRVEVPLSLPVNSPLPWNAEEPNLYTLVLDVASEGRLLQSLKTRIGFRQTEVRGGEILINDRPVKIRGTCHHDSHPLMGRAVTPELEYLDCQTIKEANLNSLRTSHYPPLPELLDAADEIGIYVEDEGSFCWTGATDDLTLAPRVMQLSCELVARDRNHPSVFMWSLCNESTVGFGLWRSYDWVKKADPSRPIGGSYQADGSMGFAIRHNPITHKEMSELESTLKAPLIWDECWCIWQDIWGDAEEIWIDPGMRDYYIEPHRNLYRQFMKSKVVQGTQIWAWSDDIFLMPGAGLEYGRGDTPRLFQHEQYKAPARGVVGDAQWGVVDGWRRKKPEFWHIKKLHSPVKVKETRLPINRKVKLAVENEHDFLNLNRLRVEWKCGSASGTVKPDVPPRSPGVIEIELPTEPKDGDTLNLTISNDQHMVDRYRFVFGTAMLPLPWEPLAGGPLRYQTQSALNGNTAFIVGQEFEIGLNTYNGWLRRGTVKGSQILRSMPELHLLPTGDPSKNLTDPRRWKASSIGIERSDNRCVVRLIGEYPDLKADYKYVIESDGTIDVSCDYEYLGKDIEVRELGFRFDVPTGSSLLAWDRNAEFSVYPDDHIGRPRGRAKAINQHKAGIPPTNAWSSDNTPLGTNDFRSTKRNINWGYIGLENGPGVAIESNGRQSLRSMLDGDRIVVHINDYFGGTGSLWEWRANYGRGQSLKTGSKGKVSARLRLIDTFQQNRIDP